MENNNFEVQKLTEDQLNDIVNAAEMAKPDEVIKMEKSIKNAKEITLEGSDGFTEEIKNISLDSSYEELLGGESAKVLAEANVSLFDIENANNELSDEDVEERVKDNLSQLMDLPEMEMIEFTSLISKYRKNKKDFPNAFAQLPQTFKNMLIETARAQGIPFTEYNKMAKMFLDEIVSQAEMDKVFVDIEKSLNEALKMPTIGDLYSEHTKEIMDVKIPEIIEKIKDTEPENAKTLEDIRAIFYRAYSLEDLKIHYEENARTRKLMRRDFNDPIRFCDEFNLKNDRSKFKMSDCRSIGPALCKVFLEEEVDDESRIRKLNIQTEDLNKFVILFCRTSMNKDPSNLMDAAYMYYGLKNITMLNLTNETKTPFAAELINNICDIIEFIREKEAEFNASNVNNKRKKNVR